MPFILRFGIPEMLNLWNDLSDRYHRNELNKVQSEFFGKLVKAIHHLGNNPFHPGLESHEIKELTRIFGHKIFESYLENKCPAARRLFWAYGPNRGEITILAVEQHPNKSRGYSRVVLSRFP
jgi:hypothetical protein